MPRPSLKFMVVKALNLPVCLAMHFQEDECADCVAKKEKDDVSDESQNRYMSRRTSTNEKNSRS